MQETVVLAGGATAYHNMAIDTYPLASVESLKEIIKEAQGILLDQQRLVFAGRQLEDDYTLLHYGIQAGNVVHLFLRLCGSISTFTTTASDDPLTEYLWLTDEARAQTAPPTAALKVKMEKVKASLTQHYRRRLHEDHRLPSLAQRACCMCFLDLVWSGKAAELVPLSDLKVKFETREAAEFGVLAEGDTEHNAGAVQQLLGLCGKDSTIALRLTRAPVPGCIGFHCDGNYPAADAQLRHRVQQSGGSVSLRFGRQLGCAALASGVPDSAPARSSTCCHAVACWLALQSLCRV